MEIQENSLSSEKDDADRLDKVRQSNNVRRGPAVETAALGGDAEDAFTARHTAGANLASSTHLSVPPKFWDFEIEV